MLDNADLDMVVNLTPIQKHFSCTLKAIGTGKHVYTEKPIATTLQDADTLISNAGRSGLKLACAPAYMIHPDIKEAKRVIDRGILGKICFVKARGSHAGPAWFSDFHTDPSWYYRKGAGSVFDMGVYPLQIVTGILGPAKRVVAFSGRAVPKRIVRGGVAKGEEIVEEVDDNTHIMLDFGECEFATIDATYCVLSVKGPRMEIYGSKGVIHLYSRPNHPPMEIFTEDLELGIRGWLYPESESRDFASPTCVPLSGSIDWTYADGVVHLAECIERNEKPLLSGEHARHVLEIMIKAYESARTGRTVELSTRH